ncbi:unnamed protein product [Colias eurytheme]|nr:unnamed protein product [Colias eurytheme]
MSLAVANRIPCRLKSLSARWHLFDVSRTPPVADNLSAECALHPLSMALKAAEKQKRYREKLKKNPEKYEEAKRKHRELYHKTKRLVKDLTTKEKRNANIIWKLRERQKKL